MPLTEKIEWEGRLFNVTWIEGGELPSRDIVTQVSAVCYTPEGNIILVSSDEDDWSLPGGHPEQGESISDALSREVWEEASAIVEDTVFLGSQKVDPVDGSPTYHQTRFWARVRLEPYDPRFEIKYRRVVKPVDFLRTLSWGRSPIAQAIYSRAEEINREKKR